MNQQAARRRRPFEPARLVLGLAAIQIAVLHLIRVSGEGEPPLPVLIAAVPGALVITAATAMITQAVRRRDRSGRPSRRGGGCGGPGGRRGGSRG